LEVLTRAADLDDSESVAGYFRRALAPPPEQKRCRRPQSDHVRTPGHAYAIPGRLDDLAKLAGASNSQSSDGLISVGQGRQRAGHGGAEVESHREVLGRRELNSGVVEVSRLESKAAHCAEQEERRSSKPA